MNRIWVPKYASHHNILVWFIRVLPKLLWIVPLLCTVSLLAASALYLLCFHVKTMLSLSSL
jgi:hypothetical protein